MLPLLAALVATVPPTPPSWPATLGKTAWIFATVGHSEFCPAGNVTVDLRTGRYSLTERAPRRVCDSLGLERPTTKGLLTGQKLARLRAAFLRVISDGFETAACREGTARDEIVVSNGGTPILVLTVGGGTGSAPDDLTCWNEATTALHDTLDETFGTRNWR